MTIQQIAAIEGTLLAVATLILAGCGTGSGTQPFTAPTNASSAPQNACTSGFNGLGGFTVTQLTSTWTYAQTQLATQPIPMNPLSGGTIQYYPPQPQAMNIEPSCEVTVQTVPDVLSKDLPASWQKAFPTDPTGVIPAPSNSDASTADAGYCEGYTLGAPGSNTVVVAQSIAGVNSKRIDGTLGYELENVIIQRITGVSTTENGWMR